MEAFGIASSILSLVGVVAKVTQSWQETSGDQNQIVDRLTDLNTSLLTVYAATKSTKNQISEKDLQIHNALAGCQRTVERLEALAKDYREKSAGMSPYETKRRLWKTGEFSIIFKDLEQAVKEIGNIEYLYLGRVSRRSQTLDRQSPSMSVAGLSEEDPWSRKLVLCLDGTGIRGYASLMILQALVKAIADKEQELDPGVYDSYSSPLFQAADDESFEVSSRVDSANDPVGPKGDAFRLCHYFDYICGTSTGGIVAIMLSTMRCTISEAVEYNRDICSGLVPRFKRLSKTFRRTQSRTNNTLKLQASFKSAFGDPDAPSDDDTRKDNGSKAFISSQQAMKMRTESGRCHTIVFVSQNTSKGHMQPYAIRSYELSEIERKQRGVLNAGVDTTQIPIVDACLATAAAPSYFKKVRLYSVDGSFRDGSICASNPVEKVHTEISNLHSETKSPIRGLLSIGGVKARKKTAHPPKWSEQTVAQYQLDDSENYIRDQQAAQNFRYDRIVCSTTCERSADPKKMLDKVETEARRFCKDKGIQQTIEDWAQYLVDIRRRRSGTVKWANYAGLSVTAEKNPVESTQGRIDIWRQLGENGGLADPFSDRDTTEP